MSGRYLGNGFCAFSIRAGTSIIRKLVLRVVPTKLEIRYGKLGQS